MDEHQEQLRLTHSDYCSIYEQHLRNRNVPYIVIDEAKRSLFGNARLEAFDYLVHHEDMPNGLVIVVGDLLQRRSVSTKRVEGLKQWEDIFGEGFSGAFAFISPSNISDPNEEQKQQLYSIDYV